MFCSCTVAQGHGLEPASTAATILSVVCEARPHAHTHMAHVHTHTHKARIRTKPRKRKKERKGQSDACYTWSDPQAQTAPTTSQEKKNNKERKNKQNRDHLHE